MPTTVPESTKTSLGQRLRAQARQRWPALAGVQVRFRGRFAYVDGELSSGRCCRCAGCAMQARRACGLYLATPSAWQDQLPPAHP